MRPDVWRKRLRRHQLDRPLKDTFEKFGEREKAVDGFRSRLKFHQQVYIAVRAGLPTLDGAEERKPPNTEGENPRLGTLQTLNRLLSGETRTLHPGNLRIDHIMGQRSAPNDSSSVAEGTCAGLGDARKYGVPSVHCSAVLGRNACLPATYASL